MASFNAQQSEEVEVVKFTSFDPSGCHFPRPYVPVLPAFPSGMPGFYRPKKHHSAFFARQCVTYSAGRYALTAALRSLGVGPGRTVLIPAYHCRTMIDPVLRLGGNVMLFPLQANLTPDWPGLEACMSTCGHAAAFVLPHYFGFPQPVREVQAWCKRYQVPYVEDCSHAMFGAYEGQPLGSFGDCAIASPYKFFASEDGGILRGLDRATTPRRSTPAIRAELKAVWRSLGKFIQQQRPTLPRPEWGDEEPPCWSDRVKQEAGVSRHYDPALESVQALRWSRLGFRMSNVDQLADARRRNYAAWLKALENLTGCHPLFQELPKGVVPYMFPLWLNDPIPVFFRLKRAGVPIFRWDELADSDCAVSGLARLSLIHLPCHQGVSAQQMNWMVEVLRCTLSAQEFK